MEKSLKRNFIFSESLLTLGRGFVNRISGFGIFLSWGKMSSFNKFLKETFPFLKDFEEHFNSWEHFEKKLEFSRNLFFSFVKSLTLEEF